MSELERRAPVQGDSHCHLKVNDSRRGDARSPGTITWTEHLEVWEAYNKKYPGQSAERLAERGGFGYKEAVELIGRPLKTWIPNQVE